jgi:hypothetical protein
MTYASSRTLDPPPLGQPIHGRHDLAVEGCVDGLAPP